MILSRHVQWHECLAVMTGAGPSSHWPAHTRSYHLTAADLRRLHSAKLNSTSSSLEFSFPLCTGLYKQCPERSK